jgi:O-antigen ligase
MLFQILISIFFLLFFILSLKNPDWAIRLIIFLLPIYLIKFNLGLVPTNLLEGMIVILFISQLSNLDIREIAQRVIQKKIFLLGIIFLSIGLFASTIFSSDSLTSLGIVKSWFLVPMILALIISQKTNKRIVPIFLNTLTFSGLAMSIIAIIYFILGITTYDGRIAAFFSHPNFLAMYLVPCFLISFSGTFKGVRKNRKASLSFSLIIIFSAILLAQSIGAVISVIFGSLIYITLSKNLSKNKKIYLLSSLLLLITVATTILLPKINTFIESDRSSLQSRITIWHSATMILEDNWLIGIGAGNFQSYYLNYQKYFPPYLEWSSPQPHNIFLAFWIQLGILGFSGFLLILFWFYRSGIKILKKEALSATLIAVMSGILIHGLVDTTYWKNDLSIVFWMIIALMLLISPRTYRLRE